MISYDELSIKAQIADLYNNGVLSLKTICVAFNTSRKHVLEIARRERDEEPLARSKAPRNVHNKSSEDVVNRVLWLRIMDGIENATTIWLKVRDVFSVSISTVKRLLKKHDLNRKKPKKKCKRFVKDRSMDMLATDWTTQGIKGKKPAKITFYEDDCSRKMFGLQAFHHATTRNSISVLLEVLDKIDKPKAILTDNGAQYVPRQKHWNHEYADLLKELEITHRRTRPRNPRCNGKAERLIRTLKDWLSKYHIQSIEHLNYLLGVFQKWYNNRPHSSLNYKTPNQVFEEKHPKITRRLKYKLTYLFS